MANRIPIGERVARLEGQVKIMSRIEAAELSVLVMILLKLLSG